ncbi:MAG TPA: hypothetical protein VHZ24_01945 [Pirellulales bacterium]|jgi:hypothetical protein|nr:hypothetical protein [Pirellulales bacterium]
MKHHVTASALLVLLTAAAAYGQAPLDDPYAIPRSAVTGWPKFYKPLKIHPHDQLYYAMGWCRTNHYYYTAADLVDIDTLDEVHEHGRVVELRDGGLIAWFDSAEKPIAVHVHPDATRLLVRGTLSPAVLRREMVVRFTGTVDRGGQLRQPIDRLDLCTAEAERQAVEVLPDVPSTVLGKIVRVGRDHLWLVIKAGSIRAVRGTLAPEATVRLDVAELRWALPGSRLSLEGRIYPADKRIPADQVFATALEIELPGSTDALPGEGSEKPSNEGSWSGGVSRR